MVKVSYWPLPKHINGAGGFPNRAVVNSRIDFTAKEKKRVINNEITHVLQQIEFSDTDEWTWKGYFRWLWEYLKEHRKHGYENNPFEIDSRDWDEDLANRPPRYWETKL